MCDENLFLQGCTLWYRAESESCKAGDTAFVWCP